MANMLEYKCPCCGGAIAFDTSLQKMKCPYCDTEFEMDVLANYDAELQGDGQDEMNWEMESSQEWTEGDAEGMRVYVCNSCGGEIVGDENMAATSCPFCDNPVVMMGQVKGDLKPDVIIPFKLDKKAAKAKFAEHLTGKKFLPKVFKTQNHIEEIKGIYVPFWLFDSKATARMRYRATRVRHWTSGNYDYTETSYYSVFRGGNIAFEHVPVDGSSKIADELMESIEPFNYKDAVPFQTAFFAGYMADRYNVDSNETIERANQRVKNSTRDSFLATVQGFNSVTPEGGTVQLSGGKAKYAMYPVWLMTTKWNGELYTFAMNGQTGKFVGNLPVDKSIAKTTFMKTFGIVAAITFVVLSGLWIL